MKNAYKIMIICLACLLCGHVALAQKNMSSKEFDELWNKVDSAQRVTVKTGNVTKDLNALEKQNIQSVNTKQQTITNPNAKKVDTTNLENLSTQPIVKGASKTKTAEKTKEKIEEKKVETKIAVTPKSETPVKTDTKKTDAKKPVSDEDFSTQPIVKGKKAAQEKSTIYTAPAKKFSLDTTKDVRSFTFETTPITNNNATYNRRNEPMPKSKEQIDDEIPVNRKLNNTNVYKDNSFVKETYAQYNKEADSMHAANKRVLDSVMKSLKIKVPVIINPNDYIDIYVNGGGVVLNNDSKLYDHISILHTGGVQREYKSKSEGVQRTEKKISKDELTKLAQYIVDMDFFDFKDDYDCADDNAACNDRLKRSPQAVPLEISVTVGDKKNKVHVSIFAPKSEKNWVNYPANIEKILNAIYAIVER